MSDNSIKLSINAKDNASKVLGSVKASTIALGVAAGNLASSGLTFLINKTRSFIDAALEAEAADMRVEAAMRGMGTYTPELSAKMKELAGVIQNEIGGSDEYFKDLISQLITLGVGTDKIDQATRAITAMEAIGKKGARAVQAIAKAVEGDYTAFEALIPSVKEATTQQEKLDAINRTLAGGYSQQQAQLLTVGGAWEALKGRLGDAQEAFTNAIFKGLGLSETFGDMQVAVGKFLEGEKWASFLENLESGARFAKELATAMTSTGGFKAVGVALGDVILAALKDGADYVGEAIKNALGKQAVKDYQEKYSNDPIARAARWLGAKSAGASNQDAAAMMDRTDLAVGGDGGSAGRLRRAIEKLKEVIEEQNKKTEENTGATKDNTGITANPPALEIKIPGLDIAKTQKELDAVNKQIAAGQANADKAGLQGEIADQQKNIAAADKKIADAQAIIKARKTPAQALAERNEQLAADKASEKENDAIMRRYNDAKKRIASAGNMGRKLSKRDQGIIDAVEGENKRQADAKRVLDQAAMDKDNAEQRKRIAEDELKGLQKDSLAELKQISQKLTDALLIG